MKKQRLDSAAATLLALWRRPVQIGQRPGRDSLALSVSNAIVVDLQETYHQAAKRAYLD